MGYIIAAVLLALILVVVLSAVRPGARGKGRLQSDRPVEFQQPSSDEPTPGASSINDPSTTQKAQHRVPPA